MFRVRLTVGSVEVTGEGSNAQAAKHAAATNALQKLKNEKQHLKSTLNPASVPFVPKSSSGLPQTTAEEGPKKSEKSIEEPSSSKEANNAASQSSAEPPGNYAELKSPISLVHENALKRNLVVKFEVRRETGPPHMRTFLTRYIP